MPGVQLDLGAHQGIRTVTRVVVEADGGSRGNPGPAGYGAVVFDADHRTVLAERHASIGRATNNVAEYRGLLAGLTAAAELGADEVDVRMDSKLVVEQMSGRWKIKHPDMIPLAAAARETAAKFRRVDYTWIPRAENAYADRLANVAMDAAAEALVSGEETSAPAEPSSSPSPAAATPASTAPGWTGAAGSPTRLLLLRHGQTPLSIERRYSGRGNPPLTELGREQAVAAARRIAARGGVAAVVSSPLGRARETATVAADALDLPVTVHNGLIETDFGEWEGLTFGEAAQRDPEIHRAWLGDTSVRPPGGESFDEVHKRIVAVRDDLVSEYGGATVLVVSHVTPIKTFLRLALDSGPSLLYRLHLDLASFSTAEFYPDGGSSVRLVNDTSHL
ncbi:bifunctional RNase H/acid phosphatase [Rhodococcus sp. (in: high G+C Gram-positive bacteria)]|uniref:bifunctional RNase H/acid phosphatase n=1 Tax=Rhodococcus sp. TaxID=1831 RepID=UPI0038902E47